MRTFHQLLPTFAYGDAITNCAIMIRGLLRARGFKSEIYSESVASKDYYGRMCLGQFNLDKSKLTESDVVVYHYSIGSAATTKCFLGSRAKRLLLYHNITPHGYFAPYSRPTYELTKHGRQSLASLRPHVDLALADSDYNLQELREMDFKTGPVLPIALNADNFEKAEPDPTVLRMFRDDHVNFLFTGRLAPNKKQEDVIRLFAWYKHRYNPKSRLILVGSAAVGATYISDLMEVARSCDVEDDICLAGHISMAELKAYYKVSNMFLCMSEHEGFCVPLLEAMFFDLPILAYGSSAIPETLGYAGCLSPTKDIPQMAEAAHQILTNPELHREIIARQRRRLKDFSKEVVTGRILNALEELGL